MGRLRVPRVAVHTQLSLWRTLLLKMIVAYLVENFRGFYYGFYIGFYLQRFETVHTGHYIELPESVLTISGDATLSRLNQSTPLNGHYVEPSESVHLIKWTHCVEPFESVHPIKWTLC